jgi:hypothetical protein
MQHQHHSLVYLFLQTVMVNIGSYLMINYDKVLGAALTFLTICYYVWKWRHEYLKSKKGEEK